MMFILINKYSAFQDTVIVDPSENLSCKNLSMSDVLPTPVLPTKINFILIILGSGIADYEI